MANREQRGNKEKRKPKSDKPKTGTQAASPYAQGPGMSAQKGAPAKKPR